jgi:hypothetical protein
MLVGFKVAYRKVILQLLALLAGQRIVFSILSCRHCCREVKGAQGRKRTA